MTKKWDYVVPEEEFQGLLRKYTRNFTQLEKEGRFDPITGRDPEIEQTILILLQKGRKNACLLAPAGVGKTALVAGLAQYIVREDVPDYLLNAQVIELEMSSMAAGTSGPAEFQERFIPICRGMAERYHNPDEPRYIMFIDEIHMIMPTAIGSSYAGLSDVMKPYLTVGDLHVIGATTRDEYRMFVALDDALDRRFQKVHLKVPNDDETFAILQNLRPRYEKHHQITVSDEQLREIVSLTTEHLRKRNQPDKSIIMMDASMAHHVMHKGRGGEMHSDSLYIMIAKEAGLLPASLSDKAPKTVDIEYVTKGKKTAQEETASDAAE